MRLRKIVLYLILAGAVPSPLLAQSGEEDSDLFGADEKFLRLGDADENITFSPFVQLDAGYVDTDPGGSQWNDNVRLARLYTYAEKGDFSGTFAYDFKRDALRYAYGSFQVSDRLAVQIGQQGEPFSLQDYSGSRFLPFAEAGRSAALVPGDNVGAVLRYSGNDHSLTGGVFAGNLNSGVDEGGLGFTGRATWAPVYSESKITRAGDAASEGVGTQRVENLLHLGVAVSAWFDIDEQVSLSGNANSSLITRTLASSPDITQADSLLRVNFEAAKSFGSLSFQGEATAARVDAPSVEGTGYGGYLYTTYFLTGERRGYSRGSGTFGRVVPKNPVDEGGFGAIEVGVRADYLDLKDLGPDGGAEWGLSGVANVYLTKRLTLTMDYTWSRVTAGLSNGLEAHAVTGRFQFAY